MDENRLSVYSSSELVIYQTILILVKLVNYFVYVITVSVHCYTNARFLIVLNNISNFCLINYFFKRYFISTKIFE